MVGNPRHSTMRRKAAASTHGRTTDKTKRAASKSPINQKSKVSALAKPLEKRRLASRGVRGLRRAVQHQHPAEPIPEMRPWRLKAISDDLQAIVSIRNEMHELRLSIKTLTERVDGLRKTTENDMADQSEPSEPTTIPNDLPDTELVESKNSMTSYELRATEPARLEATPASDH